MPTILITGANGFIGRVLCKKMFADGYCVRGAVRGPTQMTALPSGIDAVQVGSIGPETDWTRALDGIEGIIHLAARVHVIRETVTDPIAAFMEVNVFGTENLARQAVEARVKRFVFLSSIGVNGNMTYDSPFNENDKPKPYTPYALSKLEAEHILHDIAIDSSMEVVIIRSPLVYGPDNPGNFLRLQRLVATGLPLPLASIKNRRSLIYVGNLADAIIACLVHPVAAGETFLLSDGRDLSTPELIQLMAKAMGRRARLIPFPPSVLKIIGRLIGKSSEIDSLIGSLCVDSSKIRRMLGWEPRFTVEEGIKKTSSDYID